MMLDEDVLLCFCDHLGVSDAAYIWGTVMAQELERTGTGGSPVPAERRIDLAPNSALVLDGLAPDVIAELKRQHAEGIINLNEKAQALKLAHLIHRMPGIRWRA